MTCCVDCDGMAGLIRIAEIPTGDDQITMINACIKAFMLFAGSKIFDGVALGSIMRTTN